MDTRTQAELGVYVLAAIGTFALVTGVGINPKLTFLKRLRLWAYTGLGFSFVFTLKGIPFVFWNRIGAFQTILATFGFAIIFGTATVTFFVFVGYAFSLFDRAIRRGIRATIALLGYDAPDWLDHPARTND